MLLSSAKHKINLHLKPVVPYEPQVSFLSSVLVFGCMSVVCMRKHLSVRVCVVADGPFNNLARMVACGVGMPKMWGVTLFFMAAQRATCYNWECVCAACELHHLIKSPRGKKHLHFSLTLMWRKAYFKLFYPMALAVIYLQLQNIRCTLYYILICHIPFMKNKTKSCYVFSLCFLIMFSENSFIPPIQKTSVGYLRGIKCPS